MPNGTRRAHTRNGRPVRAASIPGRKSPKRRLNAAAKRRAQSKPMLAGAAGLLGLGALDAILNGRWGGFLVLGGLAVGLAVTHYGWQWHKKRQATRPAKPKPQRQQAKMAEARKYAFSREGLREFWTGKTTRPVEPAGTRRAPAKTGYKPPPLSSDDSEEPIGPRWDPPKRAVPQTDGTVANLYTPRKTTRKPTQRPRTSLDELLHPDTEASRKFYALRESGYRGPIDQDGNKVTSGPEFDILQRMQR